MADKDLAVHPTPGTVRTDLGEAPAEATLGATPLGGDTTASDAAAVAAIEGAQAQAYGVADDGTPVATDLGVPPSRDLDAFGDEIEPEPAALAPAHPVGQPGPAPAPQTDPYAGVEPHLVAAAQGMNWTDEQIQGHIQSVGTERAAADFGRYHSSIVQEASQASYEIGIPGVQGPGSTPPGFVPTLDAFGGQPAPAPAVYPGPQATPAPPPAYPSPGQPAPPVAAPGAASPAQPFFSPEAKTKLIEGLGATEGQSLIDAMETAMGQQTLAMTQIQAQVQESQQAAQNAVAAHQMEQVHSELTRLGTSKGSNADYYGKDVARANPEQLQHRSRTMDLAGAIAASHRSRGRPISVDLAIQRAHIAETAHMAEQAGRRSVETQVVQRARAVSIPPGGAGSGVRRAPNPEEDAISAITATWAKHGVQV